MENKGKPEPNNQSRGNVGSKAKIIANAAKKAEAAQAQAQAPPPPPTPPAPPAPKNLLRGIVGKKLAKAPRAVAPKPALPSGKAEAIAKVKAKATGAVAPKPAVAPGKAKAANIGRSNLLAQIKSNYKSTLRKVNNNGQTKITKTNPGMGGLADVLSRRIAFNGSNSESGSNSGSEWDSNSN